jgi:type IV secretory pathway VirB2 component (pilin)
MISSKLIAPDLQARRKAQTSSRTRNRSWSRILLQITSHGMNYNIATILAVIAILFVLLTYVTGAPLVPVAVILLALAIIFGGNAFRRV